MAKVLLSLATKSQEQIIALQEAGLDLQPYLRELLSLGQLDSTFYHWLEAHYGQQITDEDFSDASLCYTAFCKINKLHCSQLLLKGYYLLAVLDYHRVFYNLLQYGKVPEAYDAHARSTAYLAPFLASNPNKAQVAIAFERLLDSNTADLLLQAYPESVMSAKAIGNAIVRRIVSLASRVVFLVADADLLEELDLQSLIWLREVIADPIVFQSSLWLGQSGLDVSGLDVSGLDVSGLDELNGCVTQEIDQRLAETAEEIVPTISDQVLYNNKRKRLLIRQNIAIDNRNKWLVILEQKIAMSQAEDWITGSEEIIAVD